MPANLSYRIGKLRERNLLDGTWLDCGCADGGYTAAMANWGADRVVGIELEEQRVFKAQAKKPGSSPLSYVCGASETLPFSDASFDGVLLNEVLEHVADETATLRDILRILRPGGHLVVMSPNRLFPFEGHGMKLGRIKLPFPVPLAPWLPSRWTMSLMSARNYWPGELREIIRTSGFEIVLTSSVLPVFEKYRWLPEAVVRSYRHAMPTLERLPVIRHFGVSTFVIARRPAELVSV
jgi:SAM-dependent methyltransferase